MARKSSTPSLTVYQGDDRAWQIVMTRNAAAFDLTDYDVYAQVREVDADTDNGGPPIAEFTVAVTSAVDGEVTLTLPKTESVKLTETVYNWDLQMADNAGWTTTVVRGTLNVTREITRL
jgi:hypothetical protein